MPLRLVFMGTPDFAVPTLLEIVGAGHEIVAVYTRAPQPAGARHGAAQSPVAREAESSACRFSRRRHCEGTTQQRDARARGRRRRGGRLWLDPAEADPGGVSARLFQSARFAVAALARRGADPTRRDGRRPRDRRHGDEDGGRARYRADRHGRTHRRSAPDATAGELHDDTGSARRRVDAASRSLRWKRDRCNSRRNRRAASPTRTRSTRAKRASTGPSRGTKSTTIAAGCRRFPAPGSSLPAPAA